MIISIGSRSIPKTIAIMRAFSKYPELWIENGDSIEYRVMPKEIRNDNKKGKEKIEGIDDYTVQQLASMRYQELMVLTTKDNGEVDYELLDTIQKVAEEYNILVAEQKDVKNTIRFEEPQVTYDDVSGRVTKLVYEQK